MGRLIVLDSEVMIIASGGHTDIPDGKQRALKLISDSMEAGDQVFLPAPALAECCHDVDQELLDWLPVATFSAAAARIAAQITVETVRAGREYSGKDPTRQELKVDAMILATAEAIRADYLYIGNDGWFYQARDAAGLRVEIRELPQLDEQAELVWETNEPEPE